MANAVSKVKLSASTKGKGVLITASSTPGTTCHQTGNSGATVIDEVWLYLVNTHTADLVATVEFGGTTNPGETIVVNVPYNQGPILAVPGLPLIDGAGGALGVSVFCATTSKLAAFGYVNRITP